MIDTLFLGEGYSITTDSDVTQLNNSIIVTGPSGAGKTMSYAEMRLLHTENSSLIVTLSKRRLVKKYLSYFSDKGYTVIDLNLVEPTGAESFYDPLFYVRTTADITYLAESIVMANPRKNTASDTDPFWGATRSCLKRAGTANNLIMLEN